jgi:hypothetical protein
MSTTTTPPALVNDGKTLGLAVLSAFKTAIDVGLGKTEAEVPKLEGDAATFGAEWLDAHATGTTGTYLKAVVGIVELGVTTDLPAISAVTVAGLHDLQQTIDAKLTALGATS